MRQAHGRGEWGQRGQSQAALAGGALGAVAFGVLLFLSPSLASGSVSFYPAFDSELATALGRTDNKVRLVSAAQRTSAIRSIMSFATQRLGLSSTDLSLSFKGHQSRTRVADNQDVIAFLGLDLGDATGTEDDDDREVIVARETLVSRSPVPSLSKPTLTAIAQKVRDTYKLPPSSTDETITAMNALTVRQVDEPTSGTLKQALPYLRSFSGRDVVNSSFKVEINPQTQGATGIVLSNWWGVGSAAATPLRKAAVVKARLEAAVQRLAPKNSFSISSCQATLYQTTQAVIPTLTCAGRENLSAAKAAKNFVPIHFSVTLSLASDYETAEERIDLDTAPTSVGEKGEAASKKGTTISKLDRESKRRGLRALAKRTRGKPGRSTASSGDEGVGEFYSFYTADEDMFYRGAKKFYDRFDTWSSAELRQVYASHLNGTSSTANADWADLVFMTSHGGMMFLSTESDNVYTYDALEVGFTAPPLGTGDLEHLLYTGCEAGSVNYCANKTATTRFTHTAKQSSVFQGLHHFAGSHGIRISSKSEEKALAKRIANYLDDGLSVREAWIDGYNDGDDYLRNFDEGCSKVRDASNCNTEDYQCSRWKRYPSVFYQDGKKNESMTNRSSYTTDISPSDPTYDIDLIYSYVEDEPTIPMTTVGKSLP